MMRNKKVKRNSTKKGMSPGTLMHVGKQRVNKASIQVVKYNDNNANPELKNNKKSLLNP